MIMPRFMPILSLLLPWVTAAGVLAEIPTLSQEIRPKTAEQVIEQLCANLTKQRSFTVNMDVTYDDVLDSGAKVQYSAYQNIWVEKPDRLRSDYTGDERVTRFFYDGKTFTLADLERDLYVTKPAPNTLDEARKAVKREAAKIKNKKNKENILAGIAKSKYALLKNEGDLVEKERKKLEEVYKVSQTEVIPIMSFA